MSYFPATDSITIAGRTFYLPQATLKIFNGRCTSLTSGGVIVLIDQNTQAAATVSSTLVIFGIRSVQGSTMTAGPAYADNNPGSGGVAATNPVYMCGDANLFVLNDQANTTWPYEGCCYFEVPAGKYPCLNVSATGSQFIAFGYYK